MNIKVPEGLVRRMQRLSEGEDDCLAELLDDLLKQHDAAPPKYATLADLGRHARMMNATPAPEEIQLASYGEELQDIMNVEFPEYLMRRRDREPILDAPDSAQQPSEART